MWAESLWGEGVQGLEPPRCEGSRFGLTGDIWDVFTPCMVGLGLCSVTALLHWGRFGGVADSLHGIVPFSDARAGLVPTQRLRPRRLPRTGVWHSLGDSGAVGNGTGETGAQQLWGARQCWERGLVCMKGSLREFSLEGIRVESSEPDAAQIKKSLLVPICQNFAATSARCDAFPLSHVPLRDL